MKKAIATIGIMVLLTLGLSAQNVKTITVSADAPYEETIDVPCDDKGLSMVLRMTYDEEYDILSMSLTPNRNVVFFRDNVIHRDIFKCKKRLRPERLGYGVLVTPKAKYKIYGSVFRSYEKKRKEHLYNQWLGNVSDNLTLLPPAITEAGPATPLITIDSIYQKFKIEGKAEKVSFRIRNVLTIDLAKYNKKCHSSIYKITSDNDLNMTCKVTIKRNPCYGTDAEIAEMEDNIKKITKSYEMLKSACPDGVAKSDTEQRVFREHKYYLLSQYPLADTSTACEKMKAVSIRYNIMVDSIMQAPCAVINDTLTKIIQERHKLNPEILVTAARSLDELAVRYIESNDRYMRADIKKEGRAIISDINKQIKNHGVGGKDANKALKLYRNAAAYFKKITITN